MASVRFQFDKVKPRATLRLRLPHTLKVWGSEAVSTRDFYHIHVKQDGEQKGQPISSITGNRYHLTAAGKEYRMKDFGLKRNGRPRKCPPRPQEANPAWRAAARAIALKPGHTNRRTCSQIRKDGTKCLDLAVKGSAKCKHHGGWRAIPKYRREDNRKAKAKRYALWALDANQRANSNQQKAKNETDTTGYGM